jgi:transcriptional regulator with PAS, ATPase and Fis domain
VFGNKMRKDKDWNRAKGGETYGVVGITGTSRVIIEIRELVAKYALESEPILMSGETGVGKNHIAATNKDLQQAVENIEFRKDLYYRLNVLEMEVPPLHRRKEDIKSLVLGNLRLLRGKKSEKASGMWFISGSNRATILTLTGK